MNDIKDALKLVRSFILNDAQVKSLLANKSAMYFISKPEEEKVNPYIVYIFKPLESIAGRNIQNVQLEFRLIGEDLQKLTALKSRLIKMLNYTRGSEVIRSENLTIYDSKLLTGGGQLQNPTTGNYELVVFFLLKF